MSGAAQRNAGVALLAVAAGLLVLILGLEAGGYDAATALGALWRGAFGSWDAFTSATLVRATPLIIIGLGFALGLRGGALNIGAEGQFYAGAIGAAWIGGMAAGWSAPVAIGASWAGAMLAGAAWMVVPVVLRLRFGVLEVISTLLLNFVAEALVSLMVQGPLQEHTHIYPQSEPIAAGRAAAGASRHAAASGIRGGARDGGPPLVRFLAHTLGIPAPRRWAQPARRHGERPGGRSPPHGFALLGSGAIAGLAGGIEVGGVSYALYQNLSPGYGFTAIAVALLARLRPLWIVASGVLFGALEAGAGGMQREAGVPAVAVYVVEAVIILVVLLADVAARRRRT